jgi:DNA-binding response OmpR family regulator
MRNIVIMVVDDELEMLMLLDMVLKKQGFIVMKAQNAAMALHLVKSLTPNLFIVDVMMPGMNGFELCNEIRTNRYTSSTPIIVFSGRGDAKSKERALQAGANAYLPKTALPNGLINEVRELLNLTPADCS